jgi:type I restriction enzyme S subunit
MMRLQLSQSVYPQFIVIYLRSLFGKRQITINAKWAVNQASINQKDVRNTFVPVPPFPEQIIISERVESTLSLSHQQDKSIDSGLMRIGLLRQSILKRAFEGKLVPQDPSDEPASVLLERIRAERTKETPRRGRKSNNSTHQMRLAQ